MKSQSFYLQTNQQPQDKFSYVHLQHGEAEAKEGSITFPRPSPVN